MTLSSLVGYSRNYQQPDLLWQEALKIVLAPSDPGNRQDCQREREISIEWRVPLSRFILSVIQVCL